MQCIDENTYIDNTLVTCAEYQLFIDELYNCQPDHWTTYRYKKGQALAPILGIRHSDAIAFYKWLTLQEGYGWRYRLPTFIEANEYPMKAIQSSSQLGYWIMDTKNRTRFTWVSPNPINPREIDYNALTYELTCNLTGEFSFDCDLDRALDLDFDQNLLHTIDQSLGLNLQKTLNLVRDRSNKNRDLNRSLYLVGGVALNQILKHTNNQDPAINFVLNLFVDIFTLRERIAERSPAFEGIRLVKERIR